MLFKQQAYSTILFSAKSIGHFTLGYSVYFVVNIILARGGLGVRSQYAGVSTQGSGVGGLYFNAEAQRRVTAT